jgi:hypothetical protein
MRPLKPLNPAKIKQLQGKWESLLAKEGLAPARRAPNPYSSGTVGHDRITRDAKVQYYQMLSSHTNNHHFESNLEGIVMHLVSQGKSFVEASKELKRFRKSRTPRTIGRIVRRYEQLWRIVRR